MKKILSILGVLLFAGSILLTSCTTNRLCPAYPPSVYQGDIQQNDNNDIIIDIESDKIRNENL